MNFKIFRTPGLKPFTDINHSEVAIYRFTNFIVDQPLIQVISENESLSINDYLLCNLTTKFTKPKIVDQLQAKDSTFSNLELYITYINSLNLPDVVEMNYLLVRREIADMVLNAFREFGFFTEEIDEESASKITVSV